MSPLLVIDAATRLVVHANAAWRRDAGVDPAGRAAADVLPAIMMRELVRVLETREARTLEGEVLGRQRCRSELQPIEDSAGVLTNVLVSYENRADTDANQRKDHFIVRAAHELRAPLTTMLLWQRLLRSRVLGSEDQDKALVAIESSATAMSQMIGNLVDMSRAVSGTFHIDLESIELDALLEATMRRAAERARARDMRVVMHVAPPLGTIQSNAHRLGQVLDLLIENAFHHSESGAQVAVTARREDAGIEIMIADSGCGIRTELLPHVFEPFSYVDDVTARGDGSLGLGLALSESIVKLLGGTIAVHSAGVGTGSTFTIRLR